MIADRITNAPLYVSLSPRLAAALEYLRQTDFCRVPQGRYELDGANLYVLVQEYTTKPRAMGRWEAHRRYMDVQYLVAGEELVGYANVQNLRLVENYDEGRDVMFFEGDGDFLTMHPGTFVILFPEDAHMPGVTVRGLVAVKKVVAKVLIG